MRYPAGAIHEAIIALEAAYPDTKEGGVVRAKVEEALDLLYRARELEEGIPHPYRPAVSPITSAESSS